jgi:hypothetical protein
VSLHILLLHQVVNLVLSIGKNLPNGLLRFWNVFCTFNGVWSRTRAWRCLLGLTYTDCERLRILTELRVNSWACYSASLCLDREALRSAWRSSCDLNCRDLLLGKSVSTFRVIKSRTDSIVQFGWSLFTNRKAFYIVAEFLGRFVLTRSKSAYMWRKWKLFGLFGKLLSRFITNTRGLVCDSAFSGE